MIPPESTQDPIDLTIAAIKACLESSHVKHLLLLSRICCSTSEPPLPFLHGEYQRLESLFQELCEEAMRAHTIIRIPLLCHSANPSYLSFFKSQKLYSSLFLSATLTQKHPFVTLEDLGRAIAQLVSFASASSSVVGKSMKRCYHLYSSLESDETVIPLMSEIWQDEIAFQPVLPRLLSFLMS